MAEDAASPSTAESSLDELLARKPVNGANTSPAESHAVPVIGKVVDLSERGMPRIQLAGRPADELVEARVTCVVGDADVGRDAIVIFENGDLAKPIVVGLLRATEPPVAATLPINVSVDGEQITLTAQNEIVLQCGKASITLTRAGKVLIRGAYLLSRSSGVNRIKGGSVQIN